MYCNKYSLTELLAVSSDPIHASESRMKTQENPNFSLSRRKFLKTLAVIGGIFLGVKGKEHTLSQKVMAQSLEPTKNPTKQPPVEEDQGNGEQSPVETNNTWSSTESMTNLAEQPSYIQEIDSKAMGVWFAGTGFAEDRSLAPEFLANFPDVNDILIHYPEAGPLIQQFLADMVEIIGQNPQSIVYLSIENGVATFTSENFTPENIPHLVIEKHDSSQYGQDMSNIIQMGVPDGEIDTVRMDFEDSRFHAIRIKENGVYKVKVYMPKSSDPYATQENLTIHAIAFGLTGKDWFKQYGTPYPNWTSILTSTNELSVVASM